MFKREKPSQFSEAEIVKEENDFINTYTDKKSGAIRILLKLYKTHKWKLLVSAVFFAVVVFVAVFVSFFSSAKTRNFCAFSL